MQPTAEGDVLGVSMEGLDYQLVQATLASIETGSLTPIIKEELKLKIQSQRLADGKDELPPAVFKEPEKLELTAEELTKRETRRSNNRRAAQKCRNKKKAVIEDSHEELDSLQKRNKELRQMMTSIEAEKAALVNQLQPPRPNTHEHEPGSNPLVNQLPPPFPITPVNDGIQSDVNLQGSTAQQLVKHDTTTMMEQPHGSSDNQNRFNIYTQMKEDDAYLMATPLSFSGRNSRASIESVTSSLSDDFADQPLISQGYLRHARSSLTPPPPYRLLATPYARQSRTSTESFTSSTLDGDFSSIYTTFPQPSTSTDTFCQPCGSPSATRACQSPTCLPCESPVAGLSYRWDGKPAAAHPSLGGYAMLDYFLNEEEAVVPDSFEYQDDDQSQYCD